MGEIVELYESDFPKLVQGLETTSSKELCTAWEDCFARKPSKAARHLTALFKGLTSTVNDRSTTRLDVFVCAIKQLQKGDASPKLTAEILGILMLETTQLSDEYLLQVLSIIVDSISTGIYAPGKWLELFPHFMSAICTRDQIEHNGRSMTGREYQTHVLDELCSIQWPPTFVANLAAIFKDMSLTQNEIKLLFDKMLKLLGELEYDNIPPLVYQLLQLSSKGHRQMVLQELIKFFNDQDAKYMHTDDKESTTTALESESLLDETVYRRDGLKRCQGTVLLHIMFAIRQDSHLGNELVKFFRLYRLLPKKILTPFTLSLALCISTDRQFQLQIFDCLKTAMMNSYKEQATRQNSAWFREVFDQGVDPDEIVLATIKHSASDWDHVLHGLIDFGSMLLDAYGSNKPAVGKSGKDSTLFGRRMCKLGSSVLFTIIKENRAMRSTIMEQILNHILPTESASTSNYLELFSKSVQVAPQVYLDNGGQKVREIFDSLAGFPEHIATAFLHAMQPLLKLSPALRDGVLLFLRKAMFLREVNTRKIAVSGLLLFLANFNTSGPFVASFGSQGMNSQSSVGTSQSFNADVHMHVQVNTKSSNEAFSLEVLGILRRSLSQQVEVRQNLYMGLYKVAKQNPYLTDGVLDMLLHQANLSIEPGAIPPLRLQRCVRSLGDSEPILLEPLSHLLFSIHRCLFVADEQHKQEDQQLDHEEEEPWTHPLASLLDDLVKALVKAELEDFELDKSAEYNKMTNAGQKNYLLATQVMGVCEALIEYSYLKSINYNSEMANDIVALFDIYQKLATVIKENSAGAGAPKKAGRPTQADADETAASTAKAATKAPKTTTKNKNKKKEVGDNNPEAKKRNRTGASTRFIKSLLSEEFVVTVLKDLILDEMPDHQEALLLLRQKEGFETHLINVAIERMTSELSTCPAVNDADNGDTFKLCCSFARLFLHRYGELVQAGPALPQVILKVIGGFGTIVSMVCSRFADKLETFLGCVVKERHKRLQGSSYANRLLPNLETAIKRLQNLLEAALDRTDEKNAYKEAVCLLQIISLLAGKIPCDSQLFTDSLSWIESVLKREAIEDTAVVKNILLLLLLMRRQQQTSNLMTTLNDLAKDVHFHLKDIDQSVELRGRKQFRVIPLDSVPMVILLIIEELMTCQADVHTALDILKAKLMTGDRLDVSWNERRTKENAICRSLMLMASVLLELIQSAFPAGPCVEALLRIVTKYYATLNDLVKYFISAHGLKKGPLGQRLEKLVKFVNSDVTRKVYPFITYIQKVSSETKVPKTKKKGVKVSTEVAQAIKESRLIPPLIYYLENYELSLIQVSQKSKVDLTSRLKMSVNRDFRIDINTNRNDVEENEEEEDKEEEGGELEQVADDEEPSTSRGTKRRSTASIDDDEEAEEGGSKSSKQENKRKKTDVVSTPKLNSTKLLKASKKRISLTPKPQDQEPF